MDALRTSGRRVVFGYWTEDILPLLLALSTCDLRLGSKELDLEYLCDDTLGGLITAEVVRRFDRRVRILHAGHSMARVRDLQAIIRSPDSLGVAVDGTGPWGRVLPTIPRLIRECGGLAVPMAAVGDFSYVRVRTRLAVPRPRGRLACVIGEEIDLSRDTPGADRLLSAAMERTRRSAWSLLRHEGPSESSLLVAEP
jgi:hypothetical protein